MDVDAIRARLRLSLMAERAMGLTSVRGGVGPGESNPLDDERAGGSAATARVERDQPRLPVRSSAQASLAEVGGVEATSSAEIAVNMAADAAFAGPVLSSADKRRRLIAMDETEVRGCTKCRLCERRTHTVFGEGDPDARIFFIGEGPGENEDLQGRPFVGRAGELLNKMIGAMGLAREQVYIANLVKCRPPNNRVPAPDEVGTCAPYLERQLEIVRPRAIVTLGLPATQYMLQSRLSMGRMRGQWHAWRGIKLMPTYHPAYVLRNQTYETRAAVWSDLQKVLVELGLPIPQKKSSE